MRKLREDVGDGDSRRQGEGGGHRGLINFFKDTHERDGYISESGWLYHMAAMMSRTGKNGKEGTRGWGGGVQASREQDTQPVSSIFGAFFVCPLFSATG